MLQSSLSGAQTGSSCNKALFLYGAQRSDLKSMAMLYPRLPSLLLLIAIIHKALLETFNKLVQVKKHLLHVQWKTYSLLSLLKLSVCSILPLVSKLSACLRCSSTSSSSSPSSESKPKSDAPSAVPKRSRNSIRHCDGTSHRAMASCTRERNEEVWEVIVSTGRYWL